MTNEKTDNIDFASDTAGEYWAQVKADNGDAVTITDVKGTGANGAIKKGDIDAYLEGLTGDDNADAVDGPQDDAQADTDTNADNEPQDDDKAPETAENDVAQKPTAKDFKEIKPIKGKSLINKTGNPFEIDGVLIEPNGEIELSGELAKSKRVARAIETGVLSVK